MRRAAAKTAATARRATASWLVVAVACCPLATAADIPRDWSRVELAWRDDPRAAGDVSAGEAVQPRRPSRRAVRRAARRGLSLDGMPVGVPRPAAPGGLEGMVPQAGPAGPAIRSGRQPPISVAATLTSPFAADEPVLAHRDQAYGGHDDARRRFDIHLPGTCSTGSLPVVVWIAGDDWQGGARADCPLVWLVERGYAVVSVDYRPCTAAPFPAPLDDCRAALATLVREATTWGVDPGRICVVGQGGGGHLAALVALADPPAGGEGAAEVAAACAIAAPAHLPSLGPAERTSAAARRLVGGPLPELREVAQAASPLAHASADDPPLLIVHGGRDAEVPATQAVGLDRALRAAGADSRLVLLDSAGHTLPLAAGSEGGNAILEFLDRVLGPGPHEAPLPAVRPAGEPAR
jgi:acetyl esterase/lipase